MKVWNHTAAAPAAHDIGASLAALGALLCWGGLIAVARLIS